MMISYLLAISDLLKSYNGMDQMYIFIFAKYVECLLNITNGIWSRPIAFIQKPNILLFEFI